MGCLFIKQLVEFGTQVFHPVIPLGASAVVTQGIDINHTADIGGTGTVLLATDDLALAGRYKPEYNSQR